MPDGAAWSLDNRLTVVLFAGLGGACDGLEAAGFPVHVAVNHDPVAVAAHPARTNDGGCRMMTDRDALIAKLEAASEGSRELDAEIALAVGWTRIPPSETRGRRGGSHGLWVKPGDVRGWDADYQRDPPVFSRSLDAAMTLVPEGWAWSVDSGGGACAVRALPNGAPDWGGGPSMHAFDAPTPALALVIAALKARRAGC